MTALKVIPWTDVIEAAPAVVKGARKIFARSQQADAEGAPGEPATEADLQGRIARLEAEVAGLVEQQASAQLIERLAEQNARVVQVVDILRVRSRLLMIVSGVLATALVGLAVWLGLR